MCQDCGCSITDNHEHHHDDLEVVKNNPQLNDSKTVEVIRNILHKNNQEAEHNRIHFNKHNVLAINIMSSPGAGKTSMLEVLADIADFKFAVIEGDLETNRDAERLEKKGVSAYQITTGTACHLDALMVHKALHNINLENIDVCFVENVGNLVCPASYDVGTHLNIVLLSIPEGNDKVMKYPVMFRKADLVIFTKTDLIPYFDYDLEAEKSAIRKLKPNADILEISTKNPDSIRKIADWINFKITMR